MAEARDTLERSVMSGRIRSAIFPGKIPTGPPRTFRLYTAGFAGPANRVFLIAHMKRPCVIVSVLAMTNGVQSSLNSADVLISTNDLTDADAYLRDARASLTTNLAAGFTAHNSARAIRINLPVSSWSYFLKIGVHEGTGNPVAFTTSFMIVPY